MSSPEPIKKLTDHMRLLHPEDNAIRTTVTWKGVLYDVVFTPPASHDNIRYKYKKDSPEEMIQQIADLAKNILETQWEVCPEKEKEAFKTTEFKAAITYPGKGKTISEDEAHLDIKSTELKSKKIKEITLSPDQLQALSKKVATIITRTLGTATRPPLGPTPSLASKPKDQPHSPPPPRARAASVSKTLYKGAPPIPTPFTKEENAKIAAVVARESEEKARIATAVEKATIAAAKENARIDAALAPASTTPKQSAPEGITSHLQEDLRGLHNFENTCYINASLQSLFKLKDIGALLSKPLTHATDEKNEFQKRMRTLHKQLISPSEDKHIINEAIKAIVDSPLIFQRFEATLGLNQTIRQVQQDAHEFIMFLAELLEFNTDPRSSINEIRIDQTDRPIGTDTQHESVIELAQVANGYKGARGETISMQELLTQNLKPEAITLNALGEGSEAVVTSQKRAFTHDDLTQLQSISIRLPRTEAERYPPTQEEQLQGVPGQLKYDNNGHIRLLKLQGEITGIFDDITLPINNTQITLRPVSVIRHIGGTPNSGHYIAILKNDDGTFTEMNDLYSRSLSSTDVSNLIKKDGYIVNYEVVH